MAQSGDVLCASPGESGARYSELHNAQPDVYVSMPYLRQMMGLLHSIILLYKFGPLDQQPQIIE